MINFKEWISNLQLNEILDLTGRNYPDIHLVGGGDSYKSDFNSIDKDGERKSYKLSCHLSSHRLRNHDPNTGNTISIMDVPSWDISLYGPQGWGLTHNANASDVYGKMLYSLKLFFEKVQPAAISFSAFEKEMSLVYKKFLDRFLKNDFLQVDEALFIHKGHISNFSEEEQKLLKTRIEQQKKSTEDALQQIRNDKISKRKEILEMRNKIGKFVRITYGRTSRVGLIVGVEQGDFKVLTIDFGEPRIYPLGDDEVEDIRISLLQSYAQDIKKLVNIVHSHYPEYREILAKPIAREVLDKVMGEPGEAGLPSPGLVIPPGLRDTGQIHSLQPRRSRLPAPGQLALFR